MQWSCWLLRFNAAKCKLMYINNSNPVLYIKLDSTTNLSVELNVVQEEKDLDIWCTNYLIMKPSLQCQRAVTKAMQLLGQIRPLNKYVSKCMLDPTWNIMFSFGALI